jgi:hypothetical protein
MKVIFLYRVKKYGTWNEGEMIVDKSSNEEFKVQIQNYLKDKYPNSSKIEVQSISKVNVY